MAMGVYLMFMLSDTEICGKSHALHTNPLLAVYIIHIIGVIALCGFNMGQPVLGVVFIDNRFLGKAVNKLTVFTFETRAPDWL